MLTIAVVNELGRDEAFAATIHEGVQPDVSVALSTFWKNGAFTGLARDLQFPHANWSEITDCLSWLLEGNGPGSRELWRARRERRSGSRKPVP